MLVSDDRGRSLATGGGAAVSPAGNRIAFVTNSGIEVIDADGSNRRRAASVPRVLIFPFIREDTEGTKVIWSPRGDRLWFDTAGDKEYSSTLYLVNVERGTRHRIVSDGFVEIVAWR